ncbi:MAG: hypothetical protein QNJ54_06985 [Prochloraceae cyanobacterium]|nr:hypothetical protein [Prochloraceae cyanobacterium]
MNISFFLRPPASKLPDIPDGSAISSGKAIDKLVLKLHPFAIRAINIAISYHLNAIGILECDRVWEVAGAIG